MLAPQPRNLTRQFEPIFTLGVEQEFNLFKQGQLVDFHTLFREALQETHSVPFRNREDAALIEAGYMLACDGSLAELATAPVDARDDGCLTLAHEVIRCRMHMLGLLKNAGVDQVAGYSTHLNITVPQGMEEYLALELSQTAGPALVLLMEGRESPGLLIRPRLGRVEIGSEYIDNPEQLAAACLILTGVMRILLQDNGMKQSLPRLKLINWEPARIRPGIFLPHHAFGGDIYVNGGSAQLELASGALITAGEMLKVYSNSALQALDQSVSMQAMQTLRSVVKQIGSLPIETGVDPSAITPQAGSNVAPLEAQTIQLIALSPNIPNVTPLFVDWEGAAFASTVNNQPMIVGLPFAQTPEFLNAAQSNNLPAYVANIPSPGANLPLPNQLQPTIVYQNNATPSPSQQASTSKAGSISAAILNSLGQLHTPGLYGNIDPNSLSQQASNLKGGLLPAAILNSLWQLQTPGLYGNIDPNSLGLQATNFKSGKGASKFGKAIFLPPPSAPTSSQTNKLLPRLLLLLAGGLAAGTLLYYNLNQKLSAAASVEAVIPSLIETLPPIPKPEGTQPPVATEAPLSIMPSILGGKVSYCTPQDSNRYVNMPLNSNTDPKVVQTELTAGDLTVQIGNIQGKCTVSAETRLMTCSFPSSAFTIPTTIINVLHHSQIIDVILFNNYCPAANQDNNQIDLSDADPTEPPAVPTVDTGSD